MRETTPTRRHSFANWLALFVVAALVLRSTDQTLGDEPTPKAAADPMVGKEAGQVRDDNVLKMKLVWCPPGVVTMEQAEYVPNEKPKITPAQAFISHAYWLGKCEVTQAEWKQLMATEPWKGEPNTQEGDDFPVTFVKWGDAMAFCRTLSELERKAGRLTAGYEYTLPTEAQWERACRARTETRFAFGDDGAKLGEYAWFDGNTEQAGEPYGHGVGQKRPNAWNLHDMHGNVLEWCRDDYVDKLPGGRDPVVIEADPRRNRVIRGGAWNIDAERCGSSVRGVAVPTVGCHFIGFRVALVLVRPAANVPASSAEPAP